MELRTMAVDKERLDELAEDDNYPAVVGSDTDEEYALDHVYAAVDEEITDDAQHEQLTMVTVGILRGMPDTSDVRLILQELENQVGYNDEIAEAIDEAREFLSIDS